MKSRRPNSRSYINRILDMNAGNVEEWLDQKELLEAEALAAEGMSESLGDGSYWSQWDSELED